jgi:hypothetical protein
MRPRPAVDFEVTLTDDQVAFYREQGYLSIDRITTDEEVEWLREVYDHLFGNRIGEEDGAYFDLGGPRAHSGREVLPQVLGPERVFPELRDTAHFTNARRMSAQLLDLPLDEVNGGGHMILKPADYGSATPWHQDEAYWGPNVVHEGVSVWLPLDPATVDSGCLQFIPESHVPEDVVEHRHINDDPTVHGLVTDHVDASKAVTCPLDPGGATFHHCRTLHYADPNTTGRERRAYITVFNAPPRRRENPVSRPWIEAEAEALAKLDSLARPDA